MTVFLTTERLCLREIGRKDFDAVAEMLRDPRVTYAWEKTFSDAEIEAWIDRRICGYRENGFDYFLAENESGQTVGQIGLLKESVGGDDCIGVGWILNARFFGKGYATEGGRACIAYALGHGAEKVVADIRPTNAASIRVAERLSMTREGEFIKPVDGKQMPHILYAVHKKDRAYV